MPSLPSLALTYFDFGGRVEPVRVALRLAGLAFVDNRISFDALPALKPTFPYGKMPVLDVDEARFAECQGILRYVGRLGGLYPSVEDPVAAMIVDEILDTFEEFVQKLIAPSFHEKDPAKVLQMREALVAGPLPAALAWIDKRLETIAAHPSFKDTVYVHDVVVWDNFVNFKSGMLTGVPTSLIDEYKTTKAIHDKVAARLSSPASRVHLPPPTTAVTSPKTIRLFGGQDTDHIRLALAFGGVPFEEDERLTSVQFEDRKMAIPDGEVPVIEVDGTVLAGKSLAILRFVGTLAGLYPAKDSLQAMKIDEVIGHLNELDVLMAASTKEQDPQKKRETCQLLVDKTIPEFIGSLDRRLAFWKSESSCEPSIFALGCSSMTLADVMIYRVVRRVKTEAIFSVASHITDVYVHIGHSYDAVACHPRVKHSSSTD